MVGLLRVYHLATRSIWWNRNALSDSLNHYLVTKFTANLSMQADLGLVVGSAMKALIMLFAQVDAEAAP